MKRFAAGLTAGVALLATPIVVHFEGWKLLSYRDPIGIVTECAGHTRSAVPGARNTHAGCAAKLRQDMQEHWAGIAACAPLEQLSEEEQAAWLSFSFNVGTGAFCGSTAARLIREGDRAGACAQLSRWVYAKGRELPGLIQRRAAERELCEAGLRPAG